MLFKKKNKNSEVPSLSTPSEKGIGVGGRPKGLFAKQIDVPVANIDFGFQRFSTEEIPAPDKQFEAPPFISTQGEAPDLSSLSVSPELPISFQSEFESALPPDVLTLPPLVVGEPFLPEPEVDLATAFDSTGFETASFEEEPEPVPSLAWGREMPGVIDVSHTDIPPETSVLEPFPSSLYTPQTIHTPEEMHFASTEMPPPLSTSSLTGPSIDDFWVHYSPGFEEAVQPMQSALQTSTTPEINPAAFLDSVQHELYPSQEATLPALENGLNPSLESELATEHHTEDVSESSLPQWDYPSFSLQEELDTTDFTAPTALNPESLNQDTLSPQALDSDDLLWAPPLEAVVETPVIKPSEHSCAQQRPSETEPVETGLEDLEILALEPIDVDKTLMFVSLQGTYALMAQLQGEITVVKIFPHNPLEHLEPEEESFVVSREGAIGNQTLYRVQLGQWQAVLKADPQTLVLHTELSGV